MPTIFKRFIIISPGRIKLKENALNAVLSYSCATAVR